MSTINKRDTDKTDVLLKANRDLFHTNDLRLLWGITNPQTLRQTINRYIKKGVLIPIYKGFYSTKPIKHLHPFALGSAALHDYSYVSCETVLVQNGIIFQAITAITYCSTKSKNWVINGLNFKSHQLKPAYLFNPVGITDQKDYRLASTERAVADMLYFNPQYYFDSYSTIDWPKVKAIQKEVGYL